MQKTFFSRRRVSRLLALIAILLTLAPLSSANAQSAAVYDFGVICENQTAPGSYTASVDVTATDGYISIPDGNTIYMWGYAFGGNPLTAAYQHPGPTLCFTEGQAVSITLHNTLPEAVSIIFPGQTGVAASGGVAPVNSLAQMAATSGTVTYAFTASRAGTFIYESGTNLQKQVQMGLFGAIIVRPTLGSNYMYDWLKSRFNQTPYSNDYMMLLSEIDPDWHSAVEEAVNDFNAGGAYDANPFSVVDYHPRYWQINGRSFPDTIAPNKAAWLPTQPYGALLHILPSAVSVIPNDASGAPASDTSDPTKYQQYPSAVRVLNVGMLNHPIHPHGNHVQVIARDSHPLLGPASEDLSYSKFDIMAGAGQVWDVLYDWTNKDYYNPLSNTVPYSVTTSGDFTDPGSSQDRILDPHNLNLLFKDPNFFSGSPYLGYLPNKNDGTATSYNQCGEYYQIWHSHALNEAANYEAGFGGMITLERIDPPGHFNCQ